MTLEKSFVHLSFNYFVIQMRVNNFKLYGHICNYNTFMLIIIIYYEHVYNFYIISKSTLSS